MILLIGGTGTVGGHVSQALADHPDVRALAHSDRSEAALRGLGVEVVRADLDEPRSLAPAFADADRLFLLTPYGSAQEAQEANALDAAEQAGVNRVVKVSVAVDADIAVSRGHHVIEERLRRSSFDVTLLRADSFATNLLMQTDAIAGGSIHFPAGEARIPHVDPRDIAAVATRALTAGDPPTGEFVLTGPESLSYTEVAERLTRALGRDVHYVDVPAPAWEGSLVEAGLPEEYAAALTELFTSWFNVRPAPQPSSTVADVTGQSPRPIDATIAEQLAPALAARRTA